MFSSLSQCPTAQSSPQTVTDPGLKLHAFPKRATQDAACIADLPNNAIVNFDVGGTRCWTTAGTLKYPNVPESDLNNFFSKLTKSSWRSSLKLLPDGEILVRIDRNGFAFPWIIDYLRCGGIPPLSDPGLLRAIFVEADFYGLPKLHDQASKLLSAKSKEVSKVEVAKSDQLEYLCRVKMLQSELMASESAPSSSAATPPPCVSRAHSLRATPRDATGTSHSTHPGDRNLLGSPHSAGFVSSPLRGNRFPGLNPYAGQPQNSSPLVDAASQVPPEHASPVRVETDLFRFFGGDGGDDESATQDLPQEVGACRLPDAVSTRVLAAETSTANALLKLHSGTPPSLPTIDMEAISRSMLVNDVPADDVGPTDASVIAHAQLHGRSFSLEEEF